jgi:hypothetical protein
MKYHSCDQSRKMRWIGHVARIRKRRGACSDFVGIPEGKKSLRRPRRKWEENTKINLQEICWRSCTVLSDPG